MTGGPVPGRGQRNSSGSTDGGTDSVRINADRDCGRNVAGRAQRILSQVTSRGARYAIGRWADRRLSSVGRGECGCIGRARVAVLASGDEIVGWINRRSDGRQKIVRRIPYSVTAAVLRTGAVQCHWES